VLATRVPRTSWVGATFLIASLGALLLSLLMGPGLAVGYGLGMGEWDRVAGQLGGQLTTCTAYFSSPLLPSRSPAFCRAGPSWPGGRGVRLLPGHSGRDAATAGLGRRHLAVLALAGASGRELQLPPAVAELVLAAALVLLGLWGHRRRDVGAGWLPAPLVKTDRAT
jgi:ABC-2 type transport system permease protein